MKNKLFRFLRVVVAAFTLLVLTAFFLDFTEKTPMGTVWLAKLQFLPSLLAGSFVVFASLVVATLLFGRIYCSIVCPLGIFQDLIAWFGRRFAGISSRRAAKKESNSSKSAAPDATDAAPSAVVSATSKPRPKRRITGRNYVYRKNPRLVRIAFLTFAIASFPLSGAFFALLEPYGVFGRIAVNVFKPIYVLGNNLLYTICKSFDNYSFYYVDARPQSWIAFLLGVASFLIFIAFASRFGRLYCNSVCPVGTILGFLSKFAFFKVRIDTERCVGCGLCSKACKGSCVDVANRRVDSSRCVVCFDCLGACKKGAISYSKGEKATVVVPNETSSVASPRELDRARRDVAQFDRGKREFLTLATLASTAAVARAAFGSEADKTSSAQPVDATNSANSTSPSPAATPAPPVDAKPDDYGLTPIKREHTISPPGSVSHQHFQNHCVGCHLCVAKCPSNVLKPSGFENGWRGWMQPRVDFSRGFCNYDCVVCGEVCPAGAILPLTKDEKHLTQTGRVVFTKENCIVYAKNTSCGACAEHCPTQAVTMVPYGENGLTIPETNVDLCVGCGGCEYICPARPFRAIHVEGNTVHQKAKPIEKEEVKVIENLDFGF